MYFQSISHRLFLNSLTTCSVGQQWAKDIQNIPKKELGWEAYLVRHQNLC